MSFLKRKKGATVAEMIVVIAVLSIISAIVVSFIIVANEKVRTGNERVYALNDVTVIESKVDAWIRKMQIIDENKLTFSTVYGEVVNGKVSSDLRVVNSSGEVHTISFFNGQLLEDSTVVYTSSVIKKVDFTVLRQKTLFSGEDYEYLIICNVTYQIHKTRKETVDYQYTFAVLKYNEIDTGKTQ